MTEKSFSAIDCISEAWSLVNGAKLPIFLGLLAMVACRFLAVIPFIGIVFVITSMILGFGLAYLGLLRAQGKVIEFSMIKEVFDLKIILYMIGLYILYLFFAMLTILPIFLIIHSQLPDMVSNIEMLITPANVVFSLLIFAWLTYVAYLWVRIIMTIPIILLERKDPWSAAVASYRATQSHVLSLSLLLFLQFVFIVLGSIPLGLGLIWALPLSYISFGVAYQKLLVKA